MKTIISLATLAVVLLAFTFDSKTTESSTSGFTHPLNPQAEVISEYGYVTHPVLQTERLHKGVDFRVNIGDPVHAAADGTVVFYGKKSSYGKMIEIQHENGYLSRYAHLSAFSDELQTGARVSSGDQIGLAGQSGHITQPQLHFELLREGKAVDPMVCLAGE